MIQILQITEIWKLRSYQLEDCWGGAVRAERMRWLSEVVAGQIGGGELVAGQNGACRK